MSDARSSSNDLQRPESLHTADSITEVTAVESTGSGSTQIVVQEEHSSLNDGTGLNSLANASASEVESYVTAPTATPTTVHEPVVGGINDDLDDPDLVARKRWKAIRLSDYMKEKDPDLVASYGYLNDLRESLEKSQIRKILQNFADFFSEFYRNL